MLIMPHAIPYGLVARIPGFHPGGFHAGDRGSIPRRGVVSLTKKQSKFLCHTSNLRMISFPYHHTITDFSFVSLPLNHRESYYFLKNVTVVHSKIFH